MLHSRSHEIFVYDVENLALDGWPPPTVAVMAFVVAVVVLVEVAAASASAEVAAAVCAFGTAIGRAPWQPIRRALAQLARPTRPLWHHGQLAVHCELVGLPSDYCECPSPFSAPWRSEGRRQLSCAELFPSIWMERKTLTIHSDE